MQQIALERRLEQGLAYFKQKKYGNALASFKEIVKDLRVLDSGKQLILAKALQGTATGCLKQGKYRKSIKSSKLALRVLHCLTRSQPEAEAEIPPTQQKLLLALHAYLRFTLDQHKRLLQLELRRGQAPKGSLLQLCRDGLKLLTKPLVSCDEESKIKLSRLQQSLQVVLKQALEWLSQEAKRSQESQQDLETLSFCKIASGPLREALLPSLGSSPQEQEKLAQMKNLQTEVETRLTIAAARDLETGNAAALKQPPELETAKKHFKSAIEKYHYLDQTEEAQSALQQLKEWLAEARPSQTSFLKKSTPAVFEKEPQISPESKKQH